MRRLSSLELNVVRRHPLAAADKSSRRFRLRLVSFRLMPVAPLKRSWSFPRHFNKDKDMVLSKPAGARRYKPPSRKSKKYGLFEAVPQVRRGREAFEVLIANCKSRSDTMTDDTVGGNWYVGQRLQCQRQRTPDPVNALSRHGHHARNAHRS